MTRLYDPDARCDSCLRPGPVGWLYQCTQDCEENLEQAASQGEPIHLDELGHFFASKLTIRDRSPAARQDKLSFFEEISQEQLAQYRPDQITEILRQRENVRVAIQNEKARAHSAATLQRLGHLVGREPTPSPQSLAAGYSQGKQWARTVAGECQYKVCHNCRPRAADRAFLSIDAIVKGEIAPTAAVGYGFHVMGGRPVANAEILKNIGCRPVPLERVHSSVDSSSFGSDVSVMELLENQIAQGQSGYNDQGQAG